MMHLLPFAILAYVAYWMLNDYLSENKQSMRPEVEQLVSEFKKKIASCTRLKDLNELQGVIARTMGDFVYDVEGGICNDMDDVWRDLSNAIETKRKEIQNS